MSRPEAAVAPLKRMDGEPVFDEPWQAQVLAMADTLITAGVVAPTAWSEALGAALRDAAAGGAPDNAETYYRAALAALEAVLAAHGGVSVASLDERQDAWRAAYLATPHGKPVVLADGE